MVRLLAWISAKCGPSLPAEVSRAAILNDSVKLIPSAGLSSGESHRAGLTLWRRQDGRFRLPFSQSAATQNTADRDWRRG